MARYKNIIYKRNPPNIGGKRWLGRKTFDEQNGFRTYEFLLVKDYFGTLVDPKFGTYDDSPYD